MYYTSNLNLPAGSITHESDRLTVGLSVSLNHWMILRMWLYLGKKVYII